MAELFPLARLCLETIAKYIAVRCEDIKLNGEHAYPDASLNELGK